MNLLQNSNQPGADELSFARTSPTSCPVPKGVSRTDELADMMADGSPWIYLIMPFDVPGKVATGDLVMINLKEPPEQGRYTLLDYGTDNVQLVRYDGQANASGRLYRWIGQSIEEREQEVAEERGLIDEYST